MAKETFVAKSTLRLTAVAALIAFGFALVVPQSAWAASVAEDRTWYDPSQTTVAITTTQQWAGLAGIVNDGTDDFSGKLITVGSLNFNGNSVKPVGSVEHPFAGTLAGGYFQNVVIDTSDSVENVGLIGYAKAPIQNVTVSNIVNAVSISEPKGGRIVKNVGVIVGYTESSLSGCKAQAPVIITSSVEQVANTTDDEGNITTPGTNFLVRNVGGVAGQALGDVSSCRNEGTINITQDSTPLTANEQSNLVINVGGIVGCLGTVDSSQNAAPGQKTNWTPPDDYDTTHGSLLNCDNSGRLTIDTPSEAGLDRFGQQAYAQSTNIGGIVGYSRGSISGCTNSAFLNAKRGTGVGGIVGGFRSLTTTSSYSGNFSSEGKDDGMIAGEQISISDCWSWGDIVGFVFPAGIAGRAGTYTTITDCLSGLNTSGADADMYIIAERWNKPFPAGIVGSTYGTVSYCANFATVGSGRDFNPETHVFTYGSGYYASGITGNMSRFTDKNLNPVSPLPEVYGCYNVGSIIANANMRQRALVGDNGGFVHDNVALQGCVSTNDLLYGDDDDENESSGGSSTNNTFVTKAQLLGTSFIDESVGTTAISILNTRCDADGWSNCWVKSNSTSLNLGYPVLVKQVSWDRTALAVENLTVELKTNAEYTGLESVPRVSVSLNGAKLFQDVDYRIIPQDGAVDVTIDSVSVSPAQVAAADMPYTFTIEGVGNYAGQATAESYKYGITKGDLASCTVAMVTKQFNAAPQTLEPEDATVTNLAGGRVDTSEYDIEFTPGGKSLTDGQAINAKKYGVTLTAKQDSEHFYGTNTSGVFNVKPAQIITSKEGDVSSGNKAEPQAIKFVDSLSEIAWYSSTAHKDATDEELVEAGAVYPYTGHAIRPTVTGVVLSGTTVDGEVPLVEGRDYRVVYGATSVDGGTENTDNVGEKGEIGYGYVMVRFAEGSNYSNYDVMRFVIDGTDASKLDISEATIKCPEEIIFESAVGKQGYKPVKVQYAGSELTEGVDYSIAYSNNAAIGTASYLITGIGLFEGEVAGTFEVVEGEAVTFTYSFNDNGTATVTGMTYNGALDSFVLNVPSSVVENGKTATVTAMGDNAFGSNDYTKLTDSESKISGVVIPQSVESIGKWAFCTANTNTQSVLSKIAFVTFMPGSRLKTIGESAFRQSSIASIELPANVETIGSRAFADCDKLSSVIFDTLDAGKPKIHALSFQYVYRATATYDYSAKAVDKYVTSTIKSQLWVADVKNRPDEHGDDSGGSGDSGSGDDSGSSTPTPDPDPTPDKPIKTAPTAWGRLWGNVGLDTMSAIVDEGNFKTGGVVVLATFDGYWDALTAAGAAGLVEAPVLMTDGSSLSSQTSKQLAKLKPKTIFVCGGTAAVKGSVANAASKAAGGAKIVRAAGENAVGTANEIYLKAAKLGGAKWADTAFICTNDGYWDALAAAPISYAKHMPIFLTNGSSSIDSSVLSTMRAGSITKVYIVGGTAAISENVATQLKKANFTVVDRLWGNTAIETSEEVAKCGLKLGMTADKMGVATNDGYWDALSGAALCGKNNSVLVLVGDSSSHSISGFVKSNSNQIITAEIFGGTAVVDATTEKALKDATTSVPSKTTLKAASL